MPPTNVDLSEALKVLVRYCEEKGVQFVLVGALVPVVLLKGSIGGPLRVGDRETTDADSVIGLDSWAEWDAFIDGLIHLGFQRDGGRMEHRLRYHTATVDLLPYGDVVGTNGVLTWPATGHGMNMAGIGDALMHAARAQILPDLTIPVAPLWSFVVLKVAAYQDRKYPRDLVDIVHVLDEYERFTPESRRYDVLDERAGVTFENAGAYLLGRDIRSNASRESQILAADFLRQIQDEYHPFIGIVLNEERRGFSESRRAYVFSLVKALLLGFE